jgi:DNA-binding response OmpR family regulator
MAEYPIILAEDMRTLRDIYMSALEAKGFAVSAAANGREALAWLEQSSPKMMILDINMPELDGIETCRLAREKVGPEVPILFLTAMDGIDVLQKCIAAGGNDFIVKTDNIDAIVQRVCFWQHKMSTAAPVERGQLLGRLAEAARGNEQKLVPEPYPVTEVVPKVREFLNGARRAARVEFGANEHQRLALLGYASGALGVAAEIDVRIRPSFWRNLHDVLRPSGGLESGQFVRLLEHWGASAVHETFRAGVKAGKADFIAYLKDPKQPAAGFATVLYTDIVG